MIETDVSGIDVWMDGDWELTANLSYVSGRGRRRLAASDGPHVHVDMHPIV